MAYSVVDLIPGVFLLAFGHFGQGSFPFLFGPLPGPLRGFLAPFVAGIGVLICVRAIAGIIAGWGLMAHQSWARMLALVLGCLSLIHFPLGTALGIYTLWVLVSQDACSQYRQLASKA
jgi:hypothetical protein